MKLSDRMNLKTHTSDGVRTTAAFVSVLAGLVCSLASSHPAFAQTSRASAWERVGTFEGRTLYLDPSTSRRSGSRIQVWTITDLKEPNATARGRAYWSKQALLEMDCSQRSMKVLQDTWYTRPMAEGEPVFQTDGARTTALPVQADSPGEILWKSACGRR